MNRKHIQGKIVALAPALFSPVFVIVLYFSTSIHLADTDRFYHFALSKVMPYCLRGLGGLSPRFSGDQETCLGPLAGPVVPEPLRP